MWLSPFPPSVAFACVDDGCLGSDDAHPDELATLDPEALPKRRRDFALGRIAARRAIAMLGLTPQPLLVGRHREPLWPDGITGTITHAAGHAAAAVAPLATTQGLGLDIEDGSALQDGVERLVTDASERLFTQGNPIRIAMLFSAKESVFKAFHRLRGEPFGFDAVHLHPSATGFSATLREAMSPRHPIGHRFPIGCICRGTLVLTSVRLAPS